MESQRRIVIFIGSMNRGGAERVVSLIANDYASKNWMVDIVLLLSSGIGYEINPKIRIIDLSFRTKSRIKRIPGWIIGIRKYLHTTNPDVVLSFIARINILVQLSAVGLNKRIFVSERNDPREDGRSIIVDKLTRVLYPTASGVIFQTQRALTFFPKLTNKYIIPNPIEVQCFSSENKTKKIVSVGRLLPQKNHQMLIESFKDVLERYPEYILEIYGEGYLRDKLESQIAVKGLKDKVKLMGNVPDIHSCISDAELFVLSSDYEGLSNALLEAMMMGLPCISTNCAGTDEYIINGKNGLIVKTGDRKGMTEAILKMLGNKNFREQCGQNATYVRKELDTEKILSRWHSILDI